MPDGFYFYQNCSCHTHCLSALYPIGRCGWCGERPVGPHFETRARGEQARSEKGTLSKSPNEQPSGRIAP